MQAAIQRIKQESLAIRQVALDFGEMRKNPMQLSIDLALNHIVLSVSNQNVTLQIALANETKKIIKALEEERESADGLKPYESPKINLDLETF